MHRLNSLAPRRLAVVFLLAVGAAAAVLTPRPGQAVGTDPTLALTGVEAFASGTGQVSLVIDGTFSFDDLVQFSFPLGVIVSRGSSFVRYGLSGDLAAGSSAAVTNGVAASEVADLLLAGSTPAAPAALVRLQNDRLTIALPADFGAGSASVIAYAVLEGDAFVSNTLTVTVP